MCLLFYFFFLSGHMFMALSFYSWCISGAQHHGCWWDQTHVWHILNISPHLLSVDSSCPSAICPTQCQRRKCAATLCSIQCTCAWRHRGGTFQLLLCRKSPETLSSFVEDAARNQCQIVIQVWIFFASEWSSHMMQVIFKNNFTNVFDQ